MTSIVCELLRVPPLPIAAVDTHQVMVPGFVKGPSVALHDDPLLFMPFDPASLLADQ